MKLKKIFMTALALVFLFVCGASYAADTVGLIDSQKILFQHPKFDEATKILLFLSSAVEGNVAQIIQRESDLERKQIIMNHSAQVMEFAAMDQAIANEQDADKKNALWEDRQRKLSDFEASLMGPIMQECQDAVQAVAGQRQMTVLIEFDSVYYGGTDITEDVIQRLKLGR